ADALDLRLAAELALGADLAGDARHLRRERAELIDHPVHGLRGAEELALEGPAVEVDRHRLRQIAFRDRADDACDLADGIDEITDQGVDGVDRRGPRAAELTCRGAVL